MTPGWPWSIKAKVSFGRIGFCMGKSQNSVIFRNYSNLWSENFADAGS